MLTHALLAGTGLMMAAAPTYAALQSAGSGRRPYPLHCRGGERLAFDTLASAVGTATAVRLSLAFVPSRRAGGPNGEGLKPSTCAWIDRPLSDVEPRQVWFAPAIGDSTPSLTVRDSSVYWSFLAYNTDSGHFEGVGHRHWRAAPAPAATASAPQRSGLRFEFRHLPLYVIGWMLLSRIPFLGFLGVWSGWRRLAGLYPSTPLRDGRRFRCGFLIMRIANYRSGTRLTAGASHLHFSVIGPFRPGHPPFSVPWSNVAVSRDGWPWFPLKGQLVIRLVLAKAPGLRILVPVSVGEGIIAASGGRLQPSQPVQTAASSQLVRQ